MNNISIIGPFKQILPLSDLPIKGPINDSELVIHEDAWIAIDNDKIVDIGVNLNQKYPESPVLELTEEFVLTPGLVDCHTHMVWGGNRSRDYTMRMSGKSYQEILAAGGGIFDSVNKTQLATSDQLARGLERRVRKQLADGITTMEIKSGYGLLPEHELRILKVIKEVSQNLAVDLVPTCLATHVCPKEYETKEFTELVLHELLPEIKKQDLSNRVDIFVEDNAFPVDLAESYLSDAKKLGFDITIHADQFTTGGSELAVKLGALSADHLEASTEREIDMLAQSDVVSVALPGASLGLGMQFTPARKLLDAGASLAISTDWNPGSAPMGDLLVQASLLGIYEKLSSAELLAGITFRAAKALGLSDRGRLSVGFQADMIAFPVKDYRDVFYNQGRVKPSMVWKKGILQ
ncbi:MAG: imidazolonepropionase [Rickettsiales bacterium]|nr:imidazolonepropionase [Rickettsiales bacterium]